MLSVLWEVLLSTRGFVRLYMGYGIAELATTRRGGGGCAEE